VTAPASRGAPASRRWWRTHPTAAAALLYAILSVVMVGQGLLPGRTLSASDYLYSAVPWQGSAPAGVSGLGSNFELTDSVVQFQPFFRYTRAQLPHAPLWNARIMAGRPYLADAQSQVFSPFALAGDAVPFWKSFAFMAILKLFVAAMGMFLLARALAMRYPGALLAGVVFAFGTFFVIWLAWPLTSIFAWAPWILLTIDWLVRRPGPLPVAALASLFALQFLGGFPESSFHLGFVVTTFFVFRLLLGWRRSRAPARSLLRPVAGYVGAGVLGAGLAALALGPFVELLVHSADYARRANAAPSHWPRKYLGALFLHDYWGRPTQVDLEAFTELRGWYAGALTLMLAAAALILRRSAERIAVAVFAVFIVCVVVGVPPVFTVLTKLPGFSAAHNERMFIYFLVCLALLAGWGLDDLTRGVTARRVHRRAVLAVAAVTACVPVVWMLVAGTLKPGDLGQGLKVAWGFANPPAPPPTFNVEGTHTADVVRDSALLIWLPLAGAGVALLALRLRERGRLSAATFAALAIALIVVDLFRANMGYNPAIPIRNATVPATGAVRYLQSRVPKRFVGVSTELLSQPLPADVGMDFGLYDARGYDYPVDKRFDALWRRSVAPGVGDFTQPEEFAASTPAAVQALDLLSVSDLLIGPLQAIKSPLSGPGLHVAYRGRDGVVYANDRALPRVLLVSAQQSVPSDAAALAAVTAPGFDGRRVAVTEQATPGVPAGSAPAAAAPGGSARLLSDEAQRVRIDATAPRRSLLVLTDTWFPGWKATVDGHPAPLQRVDYLLRGVTVGPGHHLVEMRYAPSGWRIGRIVSVVSLLVLIALAVLGLRARRRRPATG
jgi:hypothetical protein